MSSLSEVLHNSRQALQIHQLAMQVIGQNTANVNTEGYSRRRLELTTGAPNENIGRWNGGGGVDIQWLGRVHDRVIESQIRAAAGEESYWRTKSDLLGGIEQIFDELSGSAISDSLQQFWSSWQDLANDPESNSARNALRQKSESLAASIRRTHGELSQRYSELNGSIQRLAGEINDLTTSIAEINVSITTMETRGIEASDLRDQRDRVIERLASIVPVTVQEGPDGEVNVYLEGQILVQRDHATELAITNQSADSRIRTTIQVGTHGAIVQPSTGSLRALIDLRDEDLAQSIQRLDAFALALARNVNDVHRTGYGMNGSHGIEYFADDVSGAENFRLSAFIIEDVEHIATAGSDGAPGDNSVALAIAGLQTERLMSDGRSTLGEFYSDSVLQLSSRREHSTFRFEIQNGAAENLRARRAEISGVSLDEEMTRLIQVQSAYDAAAKVITVVDEMLETLLNL